MKDGFASAFSFGIAFALACAFVVVRLALVRILFLFHHASLALFHLLLLFPAHHTTHRFYLTMRLLHDEYNSVVFSPRTPKETCALCFVTGIRRLYTPAQERRPYPSK